MRGRVILWAALPAFFVSLSFGYDWSTNPGDGNLENPYQISEPNQINSIGTDPNLMDKHFILMNNLDLSNFDGQNGNPAFNPIGSSTYKFIGVFDGDHHLIDHYTGTSALFAYIGTDGTITNLFLTGLKVQKIGAAGLVGVNYGNILTCSVDGFINGRAGLAGSNNGTIEDCHVTVTIWCGNLSNNGSGGLVGSNYGIITSSSSRGEIWVMSAANKVGGFCGLNLGTLRNCHANVYTHDGEENVGGFVGRNGEESFYPSDSVIIGCSAEGKVSGLNNVGGLAGYNEGVIIDSYSDRSGLEDPWVGGILNVGGLVGYNYSGSVIRCYSVGEVWGDYFSSRNEATGGLIGCNEYGHISNCYASGDVYTYVLNTGQTNFNYHDVGGLIGYSRGMIHDCGSASTIHIEIDQTYSTAFSICVGGLVGRGDSIFVNNCFAVSNITLEDVGYSSRSIFLGGLAGHISGTIRNSYTWNQLAGIWDWNEYDGGLIGYCDATVTDCYAVGTMTNVNRNHDGGIASQCGNKCSFVNCFWDTDVSGLLDGVGDQDPDPNGVTGLTTALMQDPNTFLIAGWDFIPETVNGLCDPWRLPAEPNRYPELSWENPQGPEESGTEEDPYRIQNLNDFIEYAALSFYWSGHTRLECDLDLSGRVYTTAPIAPSYGEEVDLRYYFQGFPFYGTFEGGGHTITHLTIAETENFHLGLFGGMGQGSVVQDLFIENCMITGGIGSCYIGGLAGGNDGGTIQRCHSDGTISGDDNIGGLVGYNHSGMIIHCDANGQVAGDYCIGGLCGITAESGDIVNSRSEADVSGTRSLGGVCGRVDYTGRVAGSYSTGTVIGSSTSIGGIAGVAAGYITNSYSTGYVSGLYFVGGAIGSGGGIIANCYSTGQVTASEPKGGFCGYTYTGSITNCFWDVGSSGIGSAGDDNFGATGKTTLQMQDPNTFLAAGWDFVWENINGTEDIWTICEGTNYPRLVWQVPKGDFVCPDGVGIEDADAFGGCWLAQVDLDTELEDDGDTVVSLSELARIGQYWLAVGCGDCGGMDLTDDGEVTMEDLSAVAGDWLAAVYPECGMADLNGDEFVDLADWAVFAGHWMEGE